MNHLFVLLLTGLSPLDVYGSRKYYLVEDRKTWADALSHCRATYTDLAVIKSDDDFTQFINEVTIHVLQSSVWIGLYGNSSIWRWTLGDQPLLDMNEWDFNEPDNYRGDENCVLITSWGWWDSSCDEPDSFICYDETKTGDDRYIYVINKETWSDARAFCRQHHTDLACARNESEKLILQQKIGLITWFGLYREPWKWVDNTEFTSISWDGAYVNHVLNNPGCGIWNMGEVVDTPCSDTWPFFCYSDVEPKTQQSIKMKIQSDRDLNDPEMKLAIMRKIEEKLKDHGLEKDVMVKWKVKEDGLVFHKEKETETAG